MTVRSTLVLSAVLSAAPVLAAETFVVDKAHSEVSFEVRHLGLSKVHGRFTDFEGTVQIDRDKPESSSVEFSVKTASVNTDNAQRDTHLKSADFLDVANHPLMTFKSSRVLSKGADRYEVTGAFTLRGVSKIITLPVTSLGFVKDPWGNQRVGFEIQTAINRKDYGVSWSQVMDNGGLVVGDEVTVMITLEAATPAAPAK